MLNVKKVVELAMARADEYGKGSYDNALECFEAIQPLIEKEGHSGFSYGQFVRIFTRILNGKVLTPITEQDFNETFPKEMCLDDRTDPNGTVTRQCVRYSSLFRDTHKDGTVSYHDVERVVIIDQYGLSWGSGHVERKCSDLIKPITLPYMPPDKPIKIYVWEFSYSKKKGLYREVGSYNSIYIDRIVYPNGEVTKVDRLYLDEDDEKPKKHKGFFLFRKLKALITEDVRQFNERG